jgi:ABC-type Zn uptake system ZnuABC Zn-binding protein ZnuA
MRRLLAAACLLLVLTTLRAADRPIVVVTTSMIATAVRAVAGEAVEVETLMPAGTCPGQFDLEPQQVRRVRTAVLVIRHEFQGFLDARFGAAGIRPEDVVAPSAGGPFTLPTNYARYCALVATEITKRVPALSASTPARLVEIRERAAATEKRLRRDAEPLRGTRVVVAAFQTDFLRWLGLDVVAVFPPDDDPSPRTLTAAISGGRERGAVLVVGNEQNGRRVPQAIAEAIGVPAVILSNFPPRVGEGAYEELLAANLRLLLDARPRNSSIRPKPAAER